MRGLIGRKDVLRHPVVVIQGFGWKAFFRVMVASRSRTFLEVISEGIPRPTTPLEIELSAQLDKMISFELRCSHIYARMADIFRDRWGLARDFFKNLSEQEEGHAEILRITKVEVSRRSLWKILLPVKPAVIEKTDKLLSDVEWTLREPDKLTIEQGLENVEKMESSEINIVFDFLIHSVSAPFVKKIYKMVPTLADHQTYLNSLLPLLKEEAAYERNLKKRSQG